MEKAKIAQAKEVLDLTIETYFSRDTADGDFAQYLKTAYPKIQNLLEVVDQLLSEA